MRSHEAKSKTVLVAQVREILSKKRVCLLFLGPHFGTGFGSQNRAALSSFV